MIELVVLAIAVAAAAGVGILVRRNEGRVRTVAEGTTTDGADPSGPRTELLAAVGLAANRPAVLHFSADWCGPCAAVRRVVAAVVTEFADAPAAPLDIEVDIDADPALAKELSVLSLPTTFVFDTAGRERFRISGVPKAADLRTALAPLTRPNAAE
ncbi:thioredoxin family protein [Nocardia uniformis]|uniref:Thioredoxin family protein n=1 Tax=Nocardia uniformis TaxID=53432 RepID=A0A849CFL7_9NOCA|nr:thioredoxin family protein [Nocardia uniformis]NNH75630.1 thioredoxin family protein [Nocardia uniformis]